MRKYGEKVIEMIQLMSISKTRFLEEGAYVAVAFSFLEITRLRATPKTIAQKTTAAKLDSAKAPVMSVTSLVKTPS
jgi:L-arabinose isomerase